MGRQGWFETPREYRERMRRAPGEKPQGLNETPRQYQARLRAAETAMRRAAEPAIQAEVKRQVAAELARLGIGKDVGKDIG